MSQKKIKASKSKKKAQENKYFFGALMGIAGLLIIGITATLLFTNTGQQVSGTGQEGKIQNELTTKYGDEWRKLGIPSWQHTKENTILYVDEKQWAGLSIDERKKRMNQAGKNYTKVFKANGGDEESVYVMFHDSVKTNIMIGTYTANSGAQIQQ